MLSRIHIRDLIIVSDLELDLRHGMTVLTGETGAGKSILIDALGLVLGDRADPEMIRLGRDRAEITADFAIDRLPEVSQWLQEQQLDADQDCILRRVINRKGSSKAYINGSPVPAKSLQLLGELLVDIHGQHAHQSLMKRDRQGMLLDEYAAHLPLVESTASGYAQWQQQESALTRLRNASRERTERLDLLRYQTQELETLALQPGELAELEQEHLRLSNADRLRDGCTAIINLLFEGDDTLHTQLAWASGELADFSTSDPQLQDPQGLLEEAAIQVQEAGHSLRSYLDDLETDPQRLASLEARLSDILHLARKYRSRPEDLPQLHSQLLAEQDQLEHADIHLAQLEQQTAQARQHFIAQAEELSHKRHSAARRLEDQVTQQMQQLGMAGGRLEISLERLETPRASGLDRIELRVAANPGQAPQPLAKTASGGELSRISLAIAVATAQCKGTPCLIFDEVDVGIGGGVAEIVGQLLRSLGDKRQVLCVTHLPQVASQGHHHLQVSKSSTSEETFTHIHPLDAPGRVEEIARMLGGIHITQQTTSHAREMLQRAQQ